MTPAVPLTPTDRDDRAVLLWGAVVLFFVVGDLVTTAVGLSTDVAREAGPLVGVVIERYGLLATVPIKLAFVAAFAVVWKVLPERYATGVPLGMAAVGVVVTAWNAAILAAGL